MNKTRPAELAFCDIRVGMKRSFGRTISKGDVGSFARLTGDMNPLHVDEKFARDTAFKGTIVHGMLAASLFSTLVGMYCPGKNALLLYQEIRYIKPIRPGATVRVEGKVLGKTGPTRVISLKTVIYGRNREILVDGEAKVKVTG